MLEINPNSLLIVISAPSGGGKTTLCQRLLAANSDILRAITCTTRAPRPGEVPGTDYFFLTQQEFQSRVSAGEFLEHASVFGNSYGTLKSEVISKLSQGKDVLLNVDVQGAATIRQQAQQNPSLKRALISVFLTPPHFSILEERLRRRGQDAPEVIQKRLNTARQEIQCWSEFDYLIISTTIDEDFRRMQAILEGEKMKISRVPALVVEGLNE